MIRVLIVEDSPQDAELLLGLLTADPEIRVIGTARNGKQGIALARELAPDLVCMDATMPGLDGYEATREIMKSCPVPVIMVTSTHALTEQPAANRAYQAGALAILEKPKLCHCPANEGRTRDLLRTIKAMAAVKVVRRREYATAVTEKSKPAGMAAPAISRRESGLVAIGASTGGPPVIQKILSRLPQPFPVPILIVQHITDGFTQGFVSWLAATSGFEVETPIHGQKALPGHVYIAPDNCHMGITSEGIITLSAGDPENGVRPSVSYLFRSVASSYGNRAVGVLLTGMGKDGAAELRAMKDCGCITLVQDQESSIVHGMPGEAIRLKGATHILPDRLIADVLRDTIMRQGQINE